MSRGPAVAIKQQFLPDKNTGKPRIVHQIQILCFAPYLRGPWLEEYARIDSQSSSTPTGRRILFQKSDDGFDPFWSKKKHVLILIEKPLGPQGAKNRIPRPDSGKNIDTSSRRQFYEIHFESILRKKQSWSLIARNFGWNVGRERWWSTTVAK